MRDKILATIAFGFFFCGLLGLHADWTLYALVFPFGWLLFGLALEFIVNNDKSTRESNINAISCALILTNISLIFVHRDTMFILGRLLCCIGATIVIVRTTTETIGKPKK